MIARIIELLIMQVWHLVRRGRAQRPRSTPPAETVVSADVVLGSIVRSPFAAPVGDGPQPTELRLSVEEKRRHVYLLGATGSGKTNLLLQLVRADIEQGRGIFLLDFRGELVDRVLMILASLCSPDELRERLVLIDLRHDDYSVPFNPLMEAAADAYTRVRFIMEVIKQQWDLGVQTEQLLRNALLALSGGWSLYELEPLLTNAAFRAEVLATVKDATVLRFFERFSRMENTSSWIEPVLNKVSPWLARPVLRNMLTQLDTVSFHRLLDRRPDSIVLVSLSADTLFGDAHLMGSLITSALVSAAMRPERRDRKGNEVCFYLDEFEHFDGMGEQFSAILSEGRKFGLCACLSHQTSIQLNPKLRNLIRNVVGTQIFFSVGGGEADTLAGEIASDEPKALMRNILMNQKIGECTVVRRGHPYTRIRTRHCPDPDVTPEQVEELRLSALRAFGRQRSEIEAELDRREERLSGSDPVPMTPARKNTRSGGKPSVTTHSTDSGTTSVQHDTILEVREDDDRGSAPRSPRKKGTKGSGGS